MTLLEYCKHRAAGWRKRRDELEQEPRSPERDEMRQRLMDRISELEAVYDILMERCTAEEVLGINQPPRLCLVPADKDDR